MPDKGKRKFNIVVQFFNSPYLYMDRFCQDKFIFYYKNNTKICLYIKCFLLIFEELYAYQLQTFCIKSVQELFFLSYHGSYELIR